MAQEQRWRSAVRKLAPVLFSFQEVRAMEAKITSEPGSVYEAVASSEEHPLKLAMNLKYLLQSADETDLSWAPKFDQRLIKAWTQETQLPPDTSFFPEYSCHSYGELKLTATSGYRIGDEYVALAACSVPVDDLMVSVLGTARNNDMSVVLRVMWNGEVWWLKLGPEAETRQKALEAPDDELPPGAWERWFQTERDMLSRSMLHGIKSTEAFPVGVEAASNRSAAMLVKDAGVSLEKRKMEPAEVYKMSKQLYEALEESGKRGVLHGDVCLENICERNGWYSLIDWGLACGRPFEELEAAVGRAWPALDVVNQTPGIPNWEMSPECCFLGVRPSNIEHDLESLFYCCMKLLGGNVLPWSDAAVSGVELDVLSLRDATVTSFVKVHERYIYEPLLLKLGLVSAQEFKAKDKPGMIPAPAAQESRCVGAAPSSADFKAISFFHPSRWKS